MVSLRSGGSWEPPAWAPDTSSPTQEHGTRQGTPVGGDTRLRPTSRQRSGHATPQQQFSRPQSAQSKDGSLAMSELQNSVQPLQPQYEGIFCSKLTRSR